MGLQAGNPRGDVGSIRDHPARRWVCPVEALVRVLKRVKDGLALAAYLVAAVVRHPQPDLLERKYGRRGARLGEPHANNLPRSEALAAP